MIQRSTRSALVCGSDVELTAAIALHLSAQRIAVALLATAGANADMLAERTGLPVFSWDVGDYDECEDGIRRMHARLGPLDILVNGAEVHHECRTVELTQPMWRNVVKVNLGGCFNLVKAVFPGMCERRFGRIISIAAAEEAAGSLANRAAAAAVQGFTRALALEGRSAGVTANSIAHARCVDSKGTPGWRQDIANAVALLCADASGGVTGSTLTIAGSLSR
jgi:acetoacetyl-CoA reductase